MLLPLGYVRAGEWADVEEVRRTARLGLPPRGLASATGCRLQVVQPGSPCLLNVAGAACACGRTTRRRSSSRPVSGVPS